MTEAQAVREWCTTSELAKRWNYSRQHIWSLRHEMQAVPQFAAGVRGSRRGLRINGKVFDAFMAYRDEKKRWGGG